MNKTLITGLAAAALLVGVRSASAIEFSDADNIHGFNLTPGTPYTTGEFNIVSSEPGDDSFTVAAPYTADEFLGSTFTSNHTFDPAHYTITSVGLQFWFQNAAGDQFTVKVDGKDFVSTASGNIYFFSNSGITGTIVSDLQLDGKVDYSVAITSGSATLDYARLKATATSTPDGGATAMLLGIGFLGAAGIRRKLS